jgi:small conductance mechanosensitive channel
MKTKPGNQTGVRRRAYALLRDNFAANGIQFARPSFNVAGDDHPASTAAALSEKMRMDQAKAVEA